MVRPILSVASATPPRPIIPHINASIEGSEFTLEVNDSATLIRVAEGKVRGQLLVDKVATSQSKCAPR
ncbi:hypothetical protein [Candidatus Thiodiazotropha endoloripes]|uniref:Uncharacterized protein n=1 Tax=Candidatus Thiodiazotropha endoloripes TaxID=1818881 RepID=A0A1E2UR98_9GAMM|nr:hypothetical protein [Candidatus Thiodiazotropha endoloripes]MCG7900964.1 hypothetical protein [Candidatus Thiodiazotropha weberae]MCG7914249.1 hypothetical protein [Candidatus Thiodiazotropha weberae]ODB97024.1 hypothetical protein A3196_09750 [Candidatus Thiodiazotropha endoloripes]